MPKTFIIARCVLALVVVVGAIAFAQNTTDVIQSIERSTMHKGRDGGITWFLPRFCVLPNKTIFLTKQEISGSDYYGPLHWQESRDNGVTWSPAQLVPGLGRFPYQGDIEETASDFTPEYHPPTKSLILLGEIIYYRNGKYFPEQPPRFPVYVIRDAQGRWSERKRLEWNDPRNSAIYAMGSSQFVILPNGDLLLPVSFRPKERAAYSVSTLLCSFDGKTIKVKSVGTELKNDVKRGLLEPQLIAYRNKYYLTIRAEDERGYISESTDGLQWSEPKPWTWENGEPLTMSTTQQHWLVHSDALYLAYTRKAEANANVMRWRAPLYLAQVDLATMRLQRSTERIVFPLVGDGINDPSHVPHYGNFHVSNISRNEAWIAAGEVIPANFRGDMLLARLRWRKPNRAVKN
ncbi:MAG TPA: sialidase family protein [Blastocatellia bacterium]|nr:sialidase family protein [Blastocatellia bacterium]